MKQYYSDGHQTDNEMHSDAYSNYTLSFTANAIQHLSANDKAAINLKDWEWHEEFIDGQRCYIVTDKRIKGTTL